MSLSYAEKHLKKPQTSSVKRASSEEKKIVNKENYINYLESQLEKSQEGNDQKIIDIHNMLVDHEDKIDNVIKLIKLLQTFAETQEQENLNIREYITKQISNSVSKDFNTIEDHIVANSRDIKMAHQNIYDMQLAIQEIDRQRKIFEMKTEKQLFNRPDIQTPIQLASQNEELKQLEIQLNRRFENIVAELKQTAQAKDVQILDFRIRNLETNKFDFQKPLDNIQFDNETQTLKKDLDDLKLILNQVLNDQQIIKFQFQNLPFDTNKIATKEEVAQLEKKQNKKLSLTIEKLGKLIETQSSTKQLKKTSLPKDHSQSSEKRLIVSNKDLLLPKATKKDRQESNQSLEFLQEKKINEKQLSETRKQQSKNQPRRKSSQRSLSAKDKSKSRNNSPFEGRINKVEALKKTKEQQVKDVIRKRKDLKSPQNKSQILDKIKKKEKK